MNDDASDRLGLAQADVGERLAGVGALVHPFAER